jgi:tetratricopeptide (TPR) repeat protein
MSDNTEPGNKSQPRSGEAPDPQFMKEFEKTIQNYADAVTAEKPEDAQNAAMQALLMAAEESLKHPTPSSLLKQQASDCEDTGDWVGAEAAHREVLALKETLDNFGMIAKAHMDLSRLLRWLGRVDEAWQHACQATAAARRTEIFPVLVMALSNESLCALDKRDHSGALAAASESVQVIEPGKMFELMRAKALVIRARCLLVSGDPADADVDLASSWETLKKQPASALMKGVTQAHANWWEVKSRLEEMRGNLSGAREAMDIAIGYLRQLQGAYALCALALALDHGAALSSLASDSTATERAASEANRIRRDLHLPFGP